jgi:acetylornithine/N-succinyldiaminopimelate aminotransferase
VNALGHAHPALVAALTEQAQKLWHVSNLYRSPNRSGWPSCWSSDLCRHGVLHQLGHRGGRTGDQDGAQVLHDEAGQPERVEILAFEGAFHGRSTGAIAAAGSEKMVKGFGPLMPGFRMLPWGDHDALRAAITDRTCAVMIEPIQGEGGIRPLPDLPEGPARPVRPDRRAPDPGRGAMRHGPHGAAFRA